MFGLDISESLADTFMFKYVQLHYPHSFLTSISTSAYCCPSLPPSAAYQPVSSVVNEHEAQLQKAGACLLHFIPTFRTMGTRQSPHIAWQPKEF